MLRSMKDVTRPMGEHPSDDTLCGFIVDLSFSIDCHIKPCGLGGGVLQQGASPSRRPAPWSHSQGCGMLNVF